MCAPEVGLSSSNLSLTRSQQLANDNDPMIQSIPYGQNQVLPYILFEKLFHMNVHHSRESQFPFHANLKNLISAFTYVRRQISKQDSIGNT